MNPQLWQTINWIKGRKNKRDWSFYRSSRRLTIPRNIPHRRFRMQTCNPQISGDLGGLEDFGEVDLSQPPVEWAGSDELAAAPPAARQEYREVQALLPEGKLALWFFARKSCP